MITLIPAYGRDYKSAKTALADWNAGKDFQISDIINGFGAYTSKRDWLGKTVFIRYNRLTQITKAQG